MSALDQIAYFQDRRDEVPNQQLAQKLARAKDKVGIREIAAGLTHDKTQVQNDCIKVLYEIGALDPALIGGYVDEFIKLLTSKNNRLVWGGMTALAALAELKAEALYARAAELQRAVDAGSVITKDNGIKALAVVASTSPARRKTLMPYLLNQLATCRPKDVPQYAEKIAVAVDASQRTAFSAVLEKRMRDMTGAQVVRVKKVLKAVAA